MALLAALALAAAFVAPGDDGPVTAPLRAAATHYCVEAQLHVVEDGLACTWSASRVEACEARGVSVLPLVAARSLRRDGACGNGQRLVSVTR